MIIHPADRAVDVSLAVVTLAVAVLVKLGIIEW